MINLEIHAEKIVTDSGWNTIVGTNKEKILDAIANFYPVIVKNNIFGNGKAAEKIIELLDNKFC